MTRTATLTLVLAVLAALSGCEADRMSEKGFSLPEGNAMNGREAFVYMHCHECHSVVNEEFPVVAMADPPFVQLGGKVTRVKTYGELVTAIIKVKPGKEMTEDEVIEFCEGLPRYKRPRKIEFRDSLPISVVGKVLRRVLREEERNK